MIGKAYLISFIVLLVLFVAGVFLWPPVLWSLILIVPILGLGIHDRLQTHHTILRVYPVLGHFRFMLEKIAPELHQYFVEGYMDGAPFSRERRSIVYERAKGVSDVQPFGTQFNLYSEGSNWTYHSITPVEVPDREPRVQIGNDQCSQPYEASRYNISAMSWGSLSGNAVLALNEGARIGGFYQNTGEGGVCKYHEQGGGDLVWQIGTGYVGCRDENGLFVPEKFEETARKEQVKMIELKLSQGAKPGHGGILPGVKVTEEIAEARGVDPGTTMASPMSHSAFHTPLEMMEFLGRLREMSGGKPIGFKLCVGHPGEFMAICKAMLDTGIRPDFITVDGAEGGTGAAPFEFSDSFGMPLDSGLQFVRNVLIGAGLKDDIRLIASGKIITGFDIASRLAMGADLCNSARGMMFALGCIQAVRCHSNECPTGITTQDPWRMKGLVVEEKKQRIARFHKETIRSFLEVISAMGVEDPADLDLGHFFMRTESGAVKSYREIYPEMKRDSLLDGAPDDSIGRAWEAADSSRFLHAKNS